MHSNISQPFLFGQVCFVKLIKYMVFKKLYHDSHDINIFPWTMVLLILVFLSNLTCLFQKNIQCSHLANSPPNFGFLPTCSGTPEMSSVDTTTWKSQSSTAQEHFFCQINNHHIFFWITVNVLPWSSCFFKRFWADIFKYVFFAPSKHLPCQPQATPAPFVTHFFWRNTYRLFGVSILFLCINQV